MKNKIAIFCLFLLAMVNGGMVQANEKPRKVWNEVVSGYNRSASIMQVTKVEMYDDRTVLTLHVDYPSGHWIKMASDTYLKAGDKSYPVKGATVIELGKEFWMPETNEVDFEMTFEPLPSDCRRIDFVEPGGWQINNIRSAEFLPQDIDDTYWRDESTGDWLIGFTSECVIYAGKFWDIVSRTEKKDTYQLMVSDGAVTLPVKVGKMKKGIRHIEIAGLPPVACSPITTEGMPDYPRKDTRRGFKDNGFRLGDQVTFVGWLKDMPEEMWKRSSEFEISYESIFSYDSENAYAEMDSLGRFSITMPLPNASQIFLDWGRTTVSTVLEPGETYFFLFDFTTGQKLFMGKNVRMQNELIAHPHSWDNYRVDMSERGKADAMKVWAKTDSIRASQMQDLKELEVKHPTLSQRYLDYVEGYYQNIQANSMLQARFYTPNYKLPKEYMDFAGKEFWQKRIQPYTIYRDFFNFLTDYLDQLTQDGGTSLADGVTQVMLRLDKEGQVSFTDAEKEVIRQYPAMVKQFQEAINKAPDEEKQAMVDAFNNGELVKSFEALLTRYLDDVNNVLPFTSVESVTEVADSLGCDKTLRDILIARELCERIDDIRKPLPESMVKLVEEEITLPLAYHRVMGMHNKYLELQKRRTSQLGNVNSANLKSGDEVKDMSDGEKILRKLIEPYKGKIILLDIWGTWCGPCKEALSHSQEEYERLKPYDMVFLYLANRSNEDSWKNVINEYNVMGENVVHYNLPEAQQSAVEHFLKVSSFPTYKLIDAFGNILPVNADPRGDLDALVRVIEMIKD